ncbi:MAG TPA: MBL fold metallo-hydrolase [Methanothermococcus okinawensis]|uniref:MBL fold metallo-hydrolase n=1 Tax=Methanothermococcus okinawensis TaxID=155863 RepID=A0A832YUB0_9EURY|nr:MBL fold metallo-hydrolase [Methanothermococcus okinawensis]
MIYKISGKWNDCNTYLIKGERKNILIDPGLPDDFDATLKEIENIVKDIDFIINTHCHYDHSGSDYLYQDYFGAPIIIHDSEVNHLKNASDVTLSSGLFHRDMIPPKEVIPLGEVLEELKRYSIEIIETPGHTKGSISIIYGDSLITGDTLFAHSVGRWDFPTGSLEDLKGSILKLEGIINKNILNVLPGHGENGNKHTISYVKKLFS